MSRSGPHVTRCPSQQQALRKGEGGRSWANVWLWQAPPVLCDLMACPSAIGTQSPLRPTSARPPPGIRPTFLPSLPDFRPTSARPPPGIRPTSLPSLPDLRPASAGGLRRLHHDDAQGAHCRRVLCDLPQAMVRQVLLRGGRPPRRHRVRVLRQESEGIDEAAEAWRRHGRAQVRCACLSLF